MPAFILFIAAFGASCAPGKAALQRAKILDTAIREWKDTSITSVNIKGTSGILLVPRSVKGKCPVVLALHGYMDDKESWLDLFGYSSGGRLTRCLLDKGIAVCAIDLPHHGARIPENAVSSQKKLVLDNWVAFYDKALLDIKNSVDYISSHNRLEAKRIGLVGYSLGGMIAYAVANSDRRIRVLVTCVAPPDRGKAYHGAPHENIANLINTPVLVIAAAHDHNYPASAAKWFFGELPSKIKEYEEYDCNHRLIPEYALRAANWFCRLL